MNEAEAKAIAQAVLGEKLAELGFLAVSVRPGLDHSGEPGLFLDLDFAPNSPVIEGRTLSEALVALRNALLDGGERRFPYLFFHYPDDERPLNEAEYPDRFQ